MTDKTNCPMYVMADSIYWLRDLPAMHQSQIQTLLRASTREEAVLVIPGYGRALFMRSFCGQWFFTMDERVIRPFAF